MALFIVVQPVCAPFEGRTEEQRRDFRKHEACVNKGVGGAFRKTRLAVAVFLQPVFVGTPVARLIAADDFKNANEVQVRSNGPVFEQHVELIHAANFGDHDDPAELFELPLVRCDRIRIELVDAASESQTNELVDVAAGFVDEIGKISARFKIPAKHQIMFPLVPPMLGDVGQKLLFFRMPNLHRLDHAIDAPVPAMLVIDVDRREYVEEPALESL